MRLPGWHKDAPRPESPETRRDARRAISAAEVSEFTQAGVLTVADDDVVEDRNAHQRPGGTELIGDLLVVVTGGRVT